MKANKNKSFALPSSKPVDVEYRLKRAAQTVEQTIMFLEAIDASVLPPGHLEGLLADVKRVQDGIDYAVAARPEKKTRAKKSVEEGK